ncbi:MAG: helix-turn-helix domain-containing protein [Actinobacteria bacterium]|nr:helix-turn-helix domain-containing protein [Actinomycetota bacterium]
MATIYEKFGENVRKLRKERGLSQEKLAEMIKRDPRTVVAIESGKRNPTLNTIHKIAQALKISLLELLQ